MIIGHFISDQLSYSTNRMYTKGSDDEINQAEPPGQGYLRLFHPIEQITTSRPGWEAVPLRQRI